MSAVIAAAPAPGSPLAFAAHQGSGGKGADPFAFAALLGAVADSSNTAAAGDASGAITSEQRDTASTRKNRDAHGSPPEPATPGSATNPSLETALAALGYAAAPLGERAAPATTRCEDVAAARSSRAGMGAAAGALQGPKDDEIASASAENGSPSLRSINDLLSGDASLGFKTLSPRTHLMAAGTGVMAARARHESRGSVSQPRVPAPSSLPNSGSKASADLGDGAGGASLSERKSAEDLTQIDAPAAAPAVEGAPVVVSAENLAAGPVTLARLPEVIADQIPSMSSSAATAPSAPSRGVVKELDIALDPAELGSISIRLRLANGKLSVVIGAANANTLSALEGARDAIVERLGGGSSQSIEELVLQAQSAPSSPTEGSNDPGTRNGASAESSSRESNRGHGEGHRPDREPSRGEGRATNPGARDLVV